MVSVEKDDRPLPHQIRRPRLTAREKNHQKHTGNRGENSSDARSSNPCRYENFITRHVIAGTLPYVKVTSLRLDAHLATKAFSDVLRLRRSPASCQRKVVRKDQLRFRESTQLGCVSPDSYPRKSVLREEGKRGSKHAVKFSKGTWRQIKIRERKGLSQGIFQKCEPHERSPCAPKFGERSHEETLH